MKDKIKVIISNEQKAVPVPTGARMLIRRCCKAVLTEEHFKGSAEISVSLVDNENIKDLNRRYRNIDRETDVLSFPLGVDGAYDVNPTTNMQMLGDIVISIEKAIEQSKFYGHSLDREIAFLTVHSMLHLLGYDHEAGEMELVRMREKEEAVLTKLGLVRNGSYYMVE